jgi:protocatechuate 3,4-dioxygenase beta subunit
MKRAAFLPLLMTVAALVFSQSPSKVAESCTVSGQVVRADSGEPLKSARLVLIEQAHSEKPHTYKAFSDAEGRFSITGIAPGRYRFAASHNGFVPQQFHPEGASGLGALLELSPGQKLDKTLFRLIPAAVITGKITDEDGQPVAGVEMEALIDPHKAELLYGDSDDQEPETAMLQSKLELVPVGMGVTNDLGEYRMYGLPAGDYYVAAIDSGMPELTENTLRTGSMGWAIGNEPVTDHPPMYYPGVFSRAEAQKLHVAPGGTVRVDLTLRSEKTVKVAGRILRENGQPAAGIYVSLEARDMDVMFSSMRNMATTDAQGRFSIENVIPGSYVLLAGKMEGQTQLSAVLPMEIAGQPPSELTLRLERGMSLSGSVRFAEPPSGAQQVELGSLRVWLSPTDRVISGGGTAEVKKDGTFRISDLRRSTYAVAINGLPSGWYLKSASLGSTDALAQGVTLGAATAPLELTISSKAAQLSGVVMLNDKPAAGAIVQLIPEPNNKFRPGLRKRAVTDQHGGFVLDSLVPGVYQIKAMIASDGEMGEAGTKSKPATATERLELMDGEKKTLSLLLKEQQQ